MNNELINALRLRIVKMMMGTGYLNSAITGAKITLLLLAKLQIPIDVTPKRVGNIFGCSVYRAMKRQQTPPRANATKIRNVYEGSFT